MTLKGEEAETVYIHLVRDLRETFDISFSIIQLPHEMKQKDELEAEPGSQTEQQSARGDMQTDAADAEQAEEGEAEVADSSEPPAAAKDELDYDENEDAKEDIPQEFQEVSLAVVASAHPSAASASTPPPLSPKDCHKITHWFADYLNY